MYGDHMNWGWGMGWFGWFWMILFWILVIFGILFLVRSFSGRVREGGVGGGETAMDILKKRYARGELTREEFERIKRDLE